MWGCRFERPALALPPNQRPAWGFLMQAFFVCPRRCWVQPVTCPRTLSTPYALRPTPYGLRTAATYRPNGKAAFQAVALHGDLHLLRKI